MGVASCTFLPAGAANERTHPERVETLWLLARLRCDLASFLSGPACLLPAAGQVLDEAEVRQDPWQLAFLGSLIGAVA